MKIKEVKFSRGKKYILKPVGFFGNRQQRAREAWVFLDITFSEALQLSLFDSYVSSGKRLLEKIKEYSIFGEYIDWEIIEF